MKFKIVLITSLFFTTHSQVFSQENNSQFNIPDMPNGTIKKFSGNDMTPYENSSQYQKKYLNEQERRSQLEQELKSLKNKLNTQQEAQTVNSSTHPNENSNKIDEQRDQMASVSPVFSSRPKHSVIRHVQSVPSYKKPMVFTVSEAADTTDSSVLPLGSYVKTRVLTGVEANSDEAYPMLLQADYAFVGPNSTKVDMSGCFFISKAKGNLSTERVMGEITDMSCVRANGEHFKRKVRGYVVGDDSTIGVTGQLISKQGQVLAAAVIANLAKGAGDALALAQQSQTIAVGNTGSAATATNITGSTAAFVGGKAIADAGTVIANWYLNYATKLTPSIAIGSGRDIWIVMLDDVQVPSLDLDSN